MLFDASATLASVHSTLHRRRLSGLFYLCCASLILFSLVRLEPRTNAAVGRARERVGGWSTGAFGAPGPAVGMIEDVQLEDIRQGQEAGTGARVDGEFDGQTIRKAKAAAGAGAAFDDDVDVDRLHVDANGTCTQPRPSRVPTTVLGQEADDVYTSVGTLCLETYASELEQFLLSAFPSNATSLSDPTSLRSLLRRYLETTLLDHSSSRSDRILPSITKRIHQTNRYDGYKPPYLKELQVWEPWSWRMKNEDWQYDQLFDAQADEWIKATFSEDKGKKGKGKSRLDGEEVTPLLQAWNEMSTTPVMRSDFFRYARLLALGGVYSDMDTKCLHPVEAWTQWEERQAGGNGRWAGRRGRVEEGGRGEPSIIVGIEADVGDRDDWHKWWPRPIQLVQWTIASAPGHPILLDTIRRILTSFASLPSHHSSHGTFGTSPGGDFHPSDETTDSHSKHVMSVVELTGPGPFTDSVLRYLGVMTEGEVRWKDLRSLPPEGLRIGDVLVLPITAFSPGVGHMGAGEVNDAGAYVIHGFAGTWKPHS